MRMLCLLPAVTEPDPGPITAGHAVGCTGCRPRRQGWRAQAWNGGRPRYP
jgi:hypothetical protein